MKLKQPGRSTTAVRIIHIITMLIITRIIITTIRIITSIHTASIRMDTMHTDTIRTTIIICMGIIITTMPAGYRILGPANGSSTEERPRDNKGRSA